MYDKIHSKLVQKKPTNDIVNFRYLSEVCDVCRTKCTLSWNKKRLQNKSEVSDLIGFFVPNYSDLSRDVKKKDFFPNSAAHTPFGRLLFILLHSATNTL